MTKKNYARLREIPTTMALALKAREEAIWSRSRIIGLKADNVYDIAGFGREVAVENPMTYEIKGKAYCSSIGNGRVTLVGKVDGEKVWVFNDEIDNISFDNGKIYLRNRIKVYKRDAAPQGTSRILESADLLEKRKYRKVKFTHIIF